MLRMDSNSAFLERLYIDNYRLVYKLVTRALRQYGLSTNDASDIVQDVFVLAAKRIDVLRQHPNPVGWLIKTSQYVCMNYSSTYARHNEQLLKHWIYMLIKRMRFQKSIRRFHWNKC